MTAKPHARTRWWSGLTSTRFLRSKIQQRVGVNALHLSPSESQVNRLDPADSDRTRLWLCVGAAFVALIVAWVVLFKVARSANIQTVPPATQGGVRP